MKKIVFITGTRADYGKMKPLMRVVESRPDLFVNQIYVTGMHLNPLFGSTYREIEKDNFRSIYLAKENDLNHSMSENLGSLIINLSAYVQKEKPDLIVVHGDRIDSFGGAIVGALNNIRVGHVEGGELSGTIDESLRHATSKLSHIHFVSNQEAKTRLLQMGEREETIFVIGSPDIDVMLSDSLPSLEKAKAKYGIPFSNYGIAMYHPVTTQIASAEERAKAFVNALEKSQKNFVVIYPNNDLGSEKILQQYQEKLASNSRFRMFPSLRFEYFLTLLKNSDFIVGNSSAGIREAPAYGIPSIDVGERQSGRYSEKNVTIHHVQESEAEILAAINASYPHSESSFDFGDGKSADRFFRLLLDPTILWNTPIQKKFKDLDNL